MPKVICPNCKEPNNDINYNCVKCKTVLMEKRPEKEEKNDEYPIEKFLFIIAVGIAVIFLLLKGCGALIYSISLPPFDPSNPG